MQSIRPVSDLMNHLADISRTVHETTQPVFLTENGYGDMVIMSMETYEQLRFASEIDAKLSEAEQEAERTEERYSSEEILEAIRRRNTAPCLTESN